MSLFTDLKEVLTPYAQKIKGLAAADEEIKADLEDYNCENLIDGGGRTDKTSGSVTFTWNADKTTCTVNGTAGSTAANCAFLGSLTSIPNGFVAGKTYHISCVSSSPYVSLNFYYYKNSAFHSGQNTTSQRDITVPDDATGMIVLISLAANASVTNATITNLWADDAYSNKQLEVIIGNAFNPKGVLRNNADLNTVKGENGYYNLTSSYTYSNCPVNSAYGGLLLVYTPIATITNQIFIDNNPTGEIFNRTYVQGTDTWSAWNNLSNKVNNLSAKGVLGNNADLNNLHTRNGFYALTSGNTYSNVPESLTYGATLVIYNPVSTITTQYLINHNPSGSNWQRCYFSGTWSVWFKSSGITNNYSFPSYENTYNITCSPTITTDTNNYLASTGDFTDRTGDIQAMLNSIGVCHLGPGTFYVTGIDIPTYGELIGCGNKTCIILDSSVTTGYAVKMGNYTTVRDLRIRGSVSNITPSSSIEERHGILFAGNASSENPSTYYQPTVVNCVVSDFTGGGITCYNTGLAPEASLLVSNCRFLRCCVGINIPYFSEFNRFTNNNAQDCYYGCVDNGGNNYFVNCDFSMNKIALIIDNSSGQSRNNTHGTFSACSFAHSDNTREGDQIVSVGTAIRILGASNGELFVGCQIGYGDIEIDESIGIRFVGCNFMRMTALEVTNSPLVVFSDCNFWDSSSSPLTQSGNITLKFSDCYLRDGTAFNPMA